MTEPAGYLMRGSWGVDLVLSHKLELPGGRDAPAAVRERMSALLAGRIGEDDLGDVLVLTSGFVTNAVRHGGAGEDDTIIVHLAIAADVIRVEVCDQGPGFAPPEILRPRVEGGGNGLILVQRMSTSWGVSGDDGTCVWFERALAPS